MFRSRLSRSLVSLVILLPVWLMGCSSGNSTTNSSEGLGVYPKAVSAADESSAIQALRTIATAQTQQKAIRGSYGDFTALTNAGLLDSRFASASPNLRGYRFTMKVSDSDFSVNADPETTERRPVTGVRHFYLDSSDNVIRVNASQPATRSDQALGGQ